MLTVAALNEYLDLDGADSPAFLALYSRVVTRLSKSDRALLDQMRVEKDVPKPATHEDDQ